MSDRCLINASTVPRALFDGGSSNEGFTIVEAVVATALVTLVAGLVLITYLLAARQVTRWQGDLAAENAVHVVQDRIATDLRSAERIVWDEAMVGGDVGNGREGLVLVYSDSSSVTYLVRDSVLVRDGRAMLPPTLAVSSFGVVLDDDVRDRAGAPAEVAPGRGASSADGSDDDTDKRGVYVEVRLGLVHLGKEPRSESALSIGARLRKPPRWAPTRALRSRGPSPDSNGRAPYPDADA